MSGIRLGRVVHRPGSGVDEGGLHGLWAEYASAGTRAAPGGLTLQWTDTGQFGVRPGGGAVNDWRQGASTTGLQTEAAT